jgi:V8-like Glu-specific endopeptidase
MRRLDPSRAALRRPALLLGLLAAAALATLPAGASAAGRAGVALQPAAEARASRSEAVARYWTAARMERAKPLDGLGRRFADGPAQSPFASASFAGVPDATLPPFSMVGRVFVQIGKFDGFCSGVAVNSESRRLVLTAGHCVFNLLPLHRFPTLARRFAFVPAYADGQAPFGIFAGRKAFLPRPWLRRGNENFDMGAVLTEPNEAGQAVADAVGGGLPVAVDKARDREYQLLGYPGHLQQRMQECDARFTGNDRNTYPLAGPPSLSVGCFMGEGASGGPWLVEGGTEIGGMTTYGYRRDFSQTFGPYFSRRNVGTLVAGL